MKQIPLFILISTIFFLIACQNTSEQEVISMFGQVYQLQPDNRLAKVDILPEIPRNKLTWSPDSKKIMLNHIEGDETDFVYTTWIVDWKGSEIQQIPHFDGDSNATWLNNNLLVVSIITVTGEAISDYESDDYIVDLRDNSRYKYLYRFGHKYTFTSPEKWIGASINKHNGFDGWFIYDLSGNRWPILENLYGELNVSRQKLELVVCGNRLENDDTYTPGLYHAAVDLTNNKTGEIKLAYPQQCYNPRWSPDGRYVMVLLEDEIAIFETDTFSITERLALNDRITYLEWAFTWSPDSKSIMVNMFYDGEAEDTYTETEESPHLTKWIDLTRINLETGETTRLTRSKRSERLDDWRIISE